MSGSGLISYGPSIVNLGTAKVIRLAIGFEVIRLVSNLARPGANITGVSMEAGAALNGKRLELLKQVVPKASGVAFIRPRPQPGRPVWNSETEAAAQALGLTLTVAAVDGPEDFDAAFAALEILIEATGKPSRIDYLFHHSARSLPASGEYRRGLEALARTRGAQLQSVEVDIADDLEPAFGAMARQRVDAVLVDNFVFFGTHAKRIAALAIEHRLATVGEGRASANAGLLLTYGVNFADLSRRAAGYVDKILKGANPGDLPIEQASKFELFVNLNTAKALGITVPQSLLLRADEVIQ